MDIGQGTEAKYGVEFSQKESKFSFDSEPVSYTRQFKENSRMHTVKSMFFKMIDGKKEALSKIVKGSYALDQIESETNWP